MKNTIRKTQHDQRTFVTANRNGLSLAEVVASTLLVSVIMIGALNSLGAVVRGRLATGDAGYAKQLANQLMAEIMETEYQEPVDPPLFGREGAESSSVRTLWDDVDDYHLCSFSPPTSRTGTKLANTTGWQREVTVEFVSVTNPATVVGTDSGLKRVTVIVRRNGTILARAVALRSDKFKRLGP